MTDAMLSLWKGPILRTPASASTAIIAEVAEKHGLTVKQLLGSRTDRTVAHPRHEAWWELRQRTSLSLPQIGRKFGRCHTTVLTGVRRHEARMAEGA